MVLYFTLPATMYRIYTVRYIHSHVLACSEPLLPGNICQVQPFRPDARTGRPVDTCHCCIASVVRKDTTLATEFVVKYRFRSAKELSHKLMRYGRKRS